MRLESPAHLSECGKGQSCLALLPAFFESLRLGFQPSDRPWQRVRRSTTFDQEVVVPAFKDGPRHTEKTTVGEVPFCADVVPDRYARPLRRSFNW